MGTNYYLFIKNKKVARDNFAEIDEYGNVDPEYEIVDEPELGYKIHLNKCSYGWRPLFQIHKAFRSFSEMESFYKKYAKDLRIFDEYGEEFSWDGYKQKMIDHAGRKPEPEKWVYGEEKVFGDGRKYLHTESCDPEEADIWIPFDHLEYTRTQKEAALRLNCHVRALHDEGDFYSHNDDEYPFDWSNGEFC